MTYKFEDHEAQTIITVSMDGSYEDVLDYLCNKYALNMLWKISKM